MKPRAFEYRRPLTLDQALAELAAEPDAKVLAGGQSLVPMMNFRLTDPGFVVDLNSVADLRGLRRRDGELQILAMTRQSVVERSQTVRSGWPLLAEALRWVAHPPIRNRGTIGGSLAHADPAAELPVVMSTLDARLLLRSAGGERVVPAVEFFLANLATVLEPGELLVRIDVPAPAAGTAWGFREFARRHGDFALGGAAVLLELEQERCRRLRFGLLAAGPRPLVIDVEEAVGLGISELAGLPVEELAGDQVEPTPDLHGSREFRRRIVLATARQALDDALARAAA